MCRTKELGGRRCPSHSNPERVSAYNAVRRSRYVANTTDADPLTVPKTDARWQKYFTSMQRISDASNIDVTNLLDATGRPYIIDENEGEGGTSCSRDYIASYKMAFTKRLDYENETKMTYVTNLCITRTGGH